MLCLHDLTRKHLSQSAFARLLEYFLIELGRHRGVLVIWNTARHEYLGGETSDTVGRPPHDILLDHEEESLCVDLTRVHLCLQPTHLVAPGHRLALDAVGTELHQTLIQSVKDTLVVDVHTLLYH